MVGGFNTLLYCREMVITRWWRWTPVVEIGQHEMTEHYQSRIAADDEAIPQWEVRLLARRLGIQRAQASVRSAIASGRSLSEELIAERRMEAEAE